MTHIWQLAFNQVIQMPRKIPTNPRKEPQQERSKITVDAILTATARILTEEGYRKASTNRIAEVAGVSIGSLYQYFPNKESLVAALCGKHSNDMVEIMESKLSNLTDVPLEIAVPELVKAAIAAHALNPKLHKVLNEEVPRIGPIKEVSNAGERITKMLRVYLETWRDRIHPKNLDLTAFILESTVESLSHAAVIEYPELLVNGELEQEVSKLLLLYLTRTELTDEQLKYSHCKGTLQ